MDNEQLLACPVHQGPSRLEALPAPLLCHILRVVESSAAPLESDDGVEAAERNPLLLVRHVSKYLRENVDSSITSINFYIKLNRCAEPTGSEDRNDILSQLSLFLRKDLPRWPCLKRLVLQLNWAARHVQLALDVLGISNCRSLQELCLQARFPGHEAPEVLKGDLSLAPLARVPHLHVLKLQGLAGYGAWCAGLSTITSLRELVVLSVGVIADEFKVPPGLKSLSISTPGDWLTEEHDYSLHLQHCTSLESLCLESMGLSSWLLPSSLKSIELTHIFRFPAAVQPLNLPHLTKLSLFCYVASERLLRLSPPPTLTYLEVFCLEGDPILDPIPDWARLTSLRSLTLSEQSSGVPKPSLFPLLEHLKLENVCHVPALSSTSLKSLSIHEGTLGACQVNLLQLTSLELLNVSSMVPLQLPWPTGLRHLSMTSPNPILAEPFSCHTCPPSLESLDLHGAQGSVHSLEFLPNLRHLTLRAPDALPTFSSSSLKSLSIVGSPVGPTLPPFDLPNLTALALKTLDRLSTLPPLTTLPALTSVTLHKLTELTEISPLRNPKLKLVDLSSESKLQALSLLDTRPRPQVVAHGCPSLVISYLTEEA